MPRQAWHDRYRSACLLHFYPRGGWITNVELGPLPEDILQRYGPAVGARIYRPSRHRVDAVIIDGGTYYLIECALSEPRIGLGQLKVYLAEAPHTPDLPLYEGQPFRGKLYVPWLYDWVRDLAKDWGIEAVEYLEPWVEAYVRQRQNYFTRAYRESRDEKMRLRRVLGVD